VARPSAKVVSIRGDARARRLRILVLSGPNLQLLGSREPEIYGTGTLEEIHLRLAERGRELGADVATYQSNHEGELVDRIGQARETFDGILLNAGAYTHTSLALFDALKAVGLPCVEVHISNPEAREEYRRESRIAPACVGKVSGFGAGSYVLALEGLVRWLGERSKSARARR
jgi:3-dehydroquinate dehydratase II